MGDWVLVVVVGCTDFERDVEAAQVLGHSFEFERDLRINESPI